MCQGRIPMHPLLRHPPQHGHAHQQSEVYRPRYLDARADAGRPPFPPSLHACKLIIVVWQSIEKWGNRRANLYWEAHLKSGHIPPDQYVPSSLPPSPIMTLIRAPAKWTPSSAPNTRRVAGRSTARPHPTRPCSIHLSPPPLTPRLLPRPSNNKQPRQRPPRAQPQPPHRRSPANHNRTSSSPPPCARARRRRYSRPPAAPRHLNRSPTHKHSPKSQRPKKTTSSRSTSTPPRPPLLPPNRRQQSRTYCRSSPPLPPPPPGITRSASSSPPLLPVLGGPPNSSRSNRDGRSHNSSSSSRHRRGEPPQPWRGAPPLPLPLPPLPRTCGGHPPHLAPPPRRICLAGELISGVRARVRGVAWGMCGARAGGRGRRRMMRLEIFGVGLSE